MKEVKCCGCEKFFHVSEWTSIVMNNWEKTTIQCYKCSKKK